MQGTIVICQTGLQRLTHGLSKTITKFLDSLLHRQRRIALVTQRA